MSVIRYLGLWATAHINGTFSPKWTKDYDNPERCREILGCGPDDVWLGSIHIYDPLLRNPIEWIREAVSKYAGEEA